MTTDINALPELPACAAIQFANGVTVAGKRHHNCLAQLHSLGISHIDGEHGFMTTHGRFVSGPAALSMRKDAGLDSVDLGGYRGSRLYSEDLY